MSAIGRRIRSFWLAALLAAMVIGSLPGTASAAARLTFYLEPGSACIAGHAAPNVTVRITWKDKAGSLKARGDYPTAEGAVWAICSDAGRLAKGDTIKVNDGIGVRTFTMPATTLIADRVANDFHGKAPANSKGTIHWHAGLFADYYEFEDISSDADGNWYFKPYPDFDLIGGIDADLEWTSPKGDSYYLRGVAPYVEVTLGRSNFTGAANPLQSVVVRLKDTQTSTLKGTDALDAGTDGSFDGMFRNTSGEPVPVAAGDRVASPLASDMNWLVPRIDVSANVATDFVNGRCFDNGLFAQHGYARVYRSGRAIGFALFDTEADGTFEVDFSQDPTLLYDPANIKRGDRVGVECSLTTGDLIQRLYRVP